MIDFKEEINKYKPIRTMEDVEDAVRDEITDIMDLLQYISNHPPKNEEQELAKTKKAEDE
ncbi:MAG: hypothetical protein FWC73_07485 [Defluviitaleaceae bacterium]|nr:hypothetical protein [Defluviitaleaceae bacterium]